MSSDYKILVPNDNFDFEKLSLVNPITLQGGTYFTKLLNDNNELYIQTPLCTSKNGFVKTAKKITCDMLFEKNNNVFIEWFENLESYCQGLIFKKSKDWFQDEIELDDIESAWTSSIRSFRSGMYNLIKTSTESPRITHSANNLTIYDQQERQLKIEEFNPDHSMVCILQIHGVKFTQKSFQIFIQLKQVMVLNDNMFNKCQIRPNVEVKSKRKISLKAYNDNEDKNEYDDDDNDNDEEDINIIKQDEPCEDEVDDEVEINTYKNEKKEDHLENDKQDHLDNNNENSLEDRQNLEEKKNLDIQEDIEEVTLNLDNTDNLETIQLKKPDEVYLEIYNEAREKAKEAKKQALLSYLELKKIKSAYPTLNFDDEDDVMDKAIENIIDNSDFQKDQTEEISKNS